jgi:hypothetical protein
MKNLILIGVVVMLGLGIAYTAAVTASNNQFYAEQAPATPMYNRQGQLANVEDTDQAEQAYRQGRITPADAWIDVQCPNGNGVVPAAKLRQYLDTGCSLASKADVNTNKRNF